ncbi:MAG: Rieske 2Fe-2S domain-containing protein [Sulfuritalea sp.]|nr:Rieske 2Fe-2S domain-containing protein [Sulfuritalea sp.]
MTTQKVLCWKDIPGAPAVGVVLTRLDEIADGGACILSLGSDAQTFGIILLRSGDAVFAYVNRCAHFGLPLASEVKFLYPAPHKHITCSVHYARYRWSDGVCDKGDCEGEFLLKIPVVVVSGDVVVATD